MKIHRQLLLTVSLLLSMRVVYAAQEYRVSSPAHRVAMLELYTSEGCSSCPPADRWLSGLKHADEPDGSVVPLAFHVTYWDYIGWRDRFADEHFDNRQRDIAHFNASRTIYTPQFVLNGRDYRSYQRFNSDVNIINAQTAAVNISVTAKLDSGDRAEVTLATNIDNSPVKDVALYLAVYENNLSSDIKDGENEGATLKHDYVVRKLYGPFILSKPENGYTNSQAVLFESDWKREQLGLAAFAQNPHSGEILQAVRLELN